MAVDSLSAALIAAADGIRNKELERRAASAFLRQEKEVSSSEISSLAAEKTSLFVRVDEHPYSGRILGVDGGLLKEQYHGIDLILLRAVAVLFEYTNGKLARHEYFPSENPAPEPTTLVDSLSEIEVLQAANILRPKKEFEIALAAVRKFRPEILVMHGSIVPHPANRANPKGPLGDSYRQMILAYKTLYEFCLQEGILLCGVVEDSRDNQFYQSIRTGPETNCRDTAILFDSLEKGERTFAMRHGGASQIGGPLGILAKNVFSFYLKPAEFDRPLKVDFLSKEGLVPETVRKVSEAIHNTSRFNRNYGLPTVTIEADARAKLREEDLEQISEQIADRAGETPLSLALRRKNRPF
jgi:hypothetical protein